MLTLAITIKYLNLINLKQSEVSYEVFENCPTLKAHICPHNFLEICIHTNTQTYTFDCKCKQTSHVFMNDPDDWITTTSLCALGSVKNVKGVVQ